MASNAKTGTAVIYARFSCSKQREASIEDQLRVCREWCEREGYRVVAEYCDRAASGRTDDRPQFQEMVSNAGESDIVLVYMMDRFSRDVYDAPIYKRKLKDKGVRVVSATESMPDGPESILIESIYEAMAAMESAHISQRVKRGMDGNAMKCMHNGVKAFGYSFTPDGRYRINPEEAEIVREMYERRIEGEAPNAIAADLAKRGWRTPLGTRMTYSAVNNILHNVKYKGTYKWGDIVVEGGMPAIVDEVTWNMAQDARAKKVRMDENWTDYALAGRGVCTCGMNLVGASGRSKRHIKYTYYRCSDKCGVRPVRADWLEERIVGELRRMLESRDTALLIAERVTEALEDDTPQRRLKEARRALKEAERGIANIMRAVEDGLDFKDVAGRLGQLKEQQRKAEAGIVLWSGDRTASTEDFADFLQMGATLDDRSLMDALVWQAVVGDDEIEVILNFDIKKNEPARLTLPRGFEQNDLGRRCKILHESKTGGKVLYFAGYVVLSLPRTA